MAVTFSCPDCGKQLRSANPIAPGKKVKCPACAVLFEPAAEADTATDAVTAKTPGKSGPRPAPRRDEDDRDRPRAKANPDRGGKRSYQADYDDEGDRPRGRRSREDDDYDDRPRTKKKKTQHSGSNLPLIFGLSGAGVLLIVFAVTAFLWPGFLLSGGGDGAAANKPAGDGAIAKNQGGNAPIAKKEGAADKGGAAAKAVAVTAASFHQEVLQSAEPVLVDFWGEGWPPCKTLAPIVDELAGEFAGKIKVVKVNVREAVQVAQTNKIEAIPTLVLYQNGKEVRRRLGAAARPELARWINESLAPAGTATKAGKALAVSAANFPQEVLQSAEPVLVDFWGEGWPPCKTLAPIVDELAGEFAGKVKVVKVNVRQAVQVAQTNKIEAIPTLVLYQNGKEVQRRLGAAPRTQLARWINQSLGWSSPGETLLMKKNDALTGADPLDSQFQNKGSRFKKLALDCEKGKRYSIHLNSDQFDCYLRLLDPQGKVIAVDDDGGGNLNSCIEFTVQVSGVHTIVVTSYDGRAGQFELTVFRVE